MILCILFWKPSKCDCFPGEIKHSRFVIFFFFFLFSSLPTDAIFVVEV